MRRIKANLIGTGLVVLLCAVSAQAAVEFMDWGFNEGSLGSLGDWAAANDSTANNRVGYVRVPTGTITRVESPYANHAEGDYAVRFDTYHSAAKITREFSVTTGTPANQYQLASNTFSTGVSLRAVYDTDTPVSWNNADYYQYIARYRLGNGEALFGLRYAVTVGGVEANLYTTAGLQRVSATQAQIEEKIGYSMIGSPVAFTMSWSAENNELALYADGQKVASKATTGTIALADGVFCVGNEGYAAWSRLCTIDEVKVWDGALSDAEVLSDFNAIPEPATMSVLVCGSICVLLKKNS